MHKKKLYADLQISNPTLQYTLLLDDDKIGKWRESYKKTLTQTSITVSYTHLTLPTNREV